MKLNPSKVVCVGLNYRDHAKELSALIPNYPLIFLKPSTSVIGDGDEIIYLEHQTKDLHYEGELAIVIKDKTHRIRAEDAKNHILGYTCGNDVTARDIQRLDGQWTRAKSFDTFCPLGPAVVPDLNPDSLKIQTFLNGNLVQNSSTSNMIFKPLHLVSFISQIMTLLPGDVILTGTPAGVGAMKKGDLVTVEIEGIGRLTNKVA
jgi:2-keto-4-pentenoate hydratase/2-oxohepta-3-ene-1,7-dioic acid hydratase in catechol pathway